MRARWLKRAVTIAAVGLFAALLLGFVVMTLWNWLGPAVFGLHTIGFGEALGLLLLSKILFGGFRGRGYGGGHWRRRMRERWERMTPEERERFRQGVMSHCRHAGQTV